MDIPVVPGYGSDCRAVDGARLKGDLLAIHLHCDAAGVLRAFHGKAILCPDGAKARTRSALNEGTP